MSTNDPEVSRQGNGVESRGAKLAVQAGQIIRKAQLLLDENIRSNQISQFGKSEDCRAGCSHCCHEVVFARLMDVVAASDYVQSNFSADQKESLAAKLFEYERVVVPHFGLMPRAVRVKCPFLERDLCTIYEARPLRCRAINSMDVEVCREIELHQDKPILRPTTPGQVELFVSAQQSVSDLLGRASLYSGAIDFARAMGILLEQPEVLNEVFGGSEDLSPAYLRKPISKVPAILGKESYYPQYGPGDEPEGNIVPADLAEHFEKFIDGDNVGAIAALKGTHPVNLMRKIMAPMLYRSEDEVLFWRESCRRAIEELGESQFDPREAFDALAALGTFEIAYQQYNDREMLTALGDTIVNRITAAALPDLAQPIDVGHRKGKIKVGYISANLTTSNGASWARGWIRNHGPEIEKYAICLADKPDAVTMQFKGFADQYFHLTGPIPANARMIKELGLDVLIYTDIGMSGRNYQYASMRLAPVQCTAWGHPVTSGLPTIDYYLSSDLMEPANGQDHYSEKLVRLPNSGLCYPRPTMPASKMSKADFGLDDGFLYLSCQNPMKYLPRWDHLYREICERTGRPIVFVEGPLPMEKNFLKARMAEAGINAKWMPWLGSPDFIALIKLADACLDSPGWNGGNTTVQGLNEGRPVVTLPGEFMRGRHSLAFATIAGAPGLVAQDQEDYVDLACDPDRMNDAIATLHSEALFGDLSPVRALDEFFQRVCR